MKICFTDIDGVLVTHRSFDIYLEQHGEHGSGIRVPFDPEAVRNLNSLTDQTGAKLVISSTWRFIYDFGALRRIFQERGVTGEVVGVTVRLQGLRGHEIEEWVRQSPEVSSYVILDDDSDMLPGQMDQLVLCHFDVGFSDPKLLNQALEILGHET